MMKAKGEFLLFAWMLTLVCFPAWGAYNNYNSILIGEQAAGMGGAVAAMAEDASAAPFYNPATLAAFKSQSLTVGANAYQKYDTVYESGIKFFEGALRANQGFFRPVPTSSGSVVKVDNSALAFSILVPDYQYIEGHVYTEDESFSRLSLLDESLWAGGAVSHCWARSCVGFSLYYTARSFTRSVVERTVEENSTALFFSEDKKVFHNNLVPIFGWYQELNDRWALGASWRTPDIPLFGSGSYSISGMEGAGDSITHSLQSTPNDAKTLTRVPQRIVFGAKFRGSRRWVATADVSWYGDTEYKDMEIEWASDHVKHISVANVALGLEIHVSPRVWFRSGVYTNRSSLGRRDDQRRGSVIDQDGFSANVSFHVTPHSHFSFGGFYTGGEGVALERVRGELTVVPITQRVFTMLIGSRVEF